MTNQLPAYLANRSTPKLADQTVGHLGVGSPPYVSIMGNRFTLIDATGAEQPVETYSPQTGAYLDCVIADAGDHMSKIYYDKAFDPNAGQYEPPVCFSDNGVGPSRNASKPQARTCAECPNNVWGSKTSAISGKGIKACSDFQKLALLIPNDSVNFLLRVPPNSLANLRGYMQKFVGQQVDVSDVLTRLTFESGQIGTLKFDAVGWIDENTFHQREKVRAEKKTDMLIGRQDLPRTEALPAPQQPAPQIAPPQEQTPFAPIAAPQSTPTVQATPTFAGAVSPSEPAPRQRRRRNSAQQSAAAQTQAAPPSSNAPVSQNFGMAQPQAVPDEIDRQLESIFGPANG